MNVSHLISEAVASGRVRRFERGEGGSFYPVQAFLRDRGITLQMRASSFLMKREGQKGRPKSLGWLGVIAEVDKIRVSEGLPPLRNSAAPQAKKVSV